MIYWSFVGAVLVVLAACGGSGGGADVGAAPDRDADIVGTVSSASPTEVRTEDCVDLSTAPPDTTVSSTDPPVCTGPSPGSGSFEVRPTSAGSDIADRIVVHVPADATLLRDGGPATFDELREGREVTVWFDGTVAESYPPQIWAEVVEIGSD